MRPPRGCSRTPSATSACRGSPARAPCTSTSRASSCSPSGRFRWTRRGSCSRSTPASPPTTRWSPSLREARDAGFRIALDGFRADAGADALLDLADSVKLDVAALDEDAIEAAVNIARGLGLQLIAGGVQTREQYGVCRGLGFDAFQGQYFAEPVVITGAAVPTYRFRALSMLAAGDATSFEQLERVISEDPGLSASSSSSSRTRPSSAAAIAPARSARR